MAATGVLFTGWLLLHMYGNLKAFAGQEAFDNYAVHLRAFGEPFLPYGGMLWLGRIVLLGALAVHATAAYTLWVRAAKARGQRYVMKKAAVATWSSRTMRWGGTTILLFVIFHVLNLTTRTITPGGDSDSPYVRMVNDFSPDVWWVPVIYLLAIGALAMHLRHGVWSAAQTFGLTNSAESRRWWNGVAYLTSAVIAGGFAVIPLSVLFGLIST
jgi:succinate dehydrogenase / fumarate reductase cytochrome b subunit